MNVEIAFNHIANRIAKELINAKENIYLATTLLAHKNLVDILVDKASKGVNVNILVSSINTNNTLLRLVNERLSVTVLDNTEEGFLHHKFCIIDEKIVINGSYDWTYKSDENHSNIMIFNNRNLAQQFINQFNAYAKPLRKAHNKPKKQEIVRHLTILENAIHLKQEDFIQKEKQVLNQYLHFNAIKNIITSLEKYDYINTIKYITHFLDNNHIEEHSEHNFLIMQLDSLNNQYNTLNTQLLEIEKLIFIFNSRFHTEVLSKLNMDNIKEIISNNSDLGFIENLLDKEKELPKLNLDKFLSLSSTEQDKFLHNAKTALEILNHKANLVENYIINAYSKLDIQEINRLSKSLKSNYFPISEDILSEEQYLQKEIELLSQKINEINLQIREIEASQIYNILKQKDLETYLKEIKQMLAIE